ncbi:MAG TPA: hypothetical protein VJP86_11795 [Vicinamibacterales bacterium]|nr:hypothetical protein [Vicinamibacterales bacterium]
MLRAALLAAVVLQPPSARVEPPMPYVDRGACPFECCQYREWQATEQMVARERYLLHRPSDAYAKSVFTIRPTERVVAMSGVVITTKPGRMRVIEPITVNVYSTSFPFRAPEPLTLGRGDLLFKLHESGEGAFVGWYKGRVLESIDVGEFGPKIVLETEPETEWWARVRNSRGQIGWVRAEGHFNNQDACGKPEAR